VSKTLDVYFDDERMHTFSAEFLRVHSPSAEVQGHGAKQPALVANKKAVGITQIDPVGHYALRLCFDDGHNSGLYSWSLLGRYAREHDTLWQDYLQRLKAANAGREPAIAVRFKP